MTAAEARAPAKINLTLHVTGRRDDGYHLLDSLVVFADLGETVTAHPAASWSLSVTGPMAATVPRGDDNLVMRAARLTDGPPAALVLDKHLPTAAGIGGGSADAAATLRALQRLDGRELPEAVASLGADVPVCLHGRTARMRGVGERLEPVPDLPSLHLCLVNPGVAVVTPRVFAGLAARSNPPMPETIPDLEDAAETVAWLAGCRNDLETPAKALVPSIGAVLATLAATPGCLLARMSGSGATCFGLYGTAAAAAQSARAIAAAQPRWWAAAAPVLR